MKCVLCVLCVCERWKEAPFYSCGLLVCFNSSIKYSTVKSDCFLAHVLDILLYLCLIQTLRP